TADFENGDNMVFSKTAIERGMEAIRNGCTIITDTNMVLAGINKTTLAKAGGKAFCYIADEDVAKIAKEKNTTRANISMEKAAEVKGALIIAVGNAPTALIKLYELIKEGKIKPDLIIGVPVGFVNVVESKELIMESGIPYIVLKGRKGGSNVAAAIVNGLLYKTFPR
ncbi:MAG: precorrin-8X methylmutase, partial [Anaerotignaceae bacterium]